jgi:hypothetical protein
MLNLREAYYKPFAEEARRPFSQEIQFHNEPVESGMSKEEDGDVINIADEHSIVSSRSDLS